MARSDEKAAYEAHEHGAQIFHDVSVVMLTHAERSDEPQDSGGEPVNDLEQKKLGDHDPQAS